MSWQPFSAEALFCLSHYNEQYAEKCKRRSLNEEGQTDGRSTSVSTRKYSAARTNISSWSHLEYFAADRQIVSAKRFSSDSRIAVSQRWQTGQYSGWEFRFDFRRNDTRIFVRFIMRLVYISNVRTCALHVSMHNPLTTLNNSYRGTVSFTATCRE